MTIGTNMELDKAIKLLIAQEGAEILDNSLLVNHLMDLQAFEIMPASKYIIKMMHLEGTMHKIYTAYQSANDPSKLLKQNVMDMVSKWGFQNDAVKYTINNIASALNWSILNDVSIDHNENVLQKKAGRHFCFKDVEIGGCIDDVLVELQNSGYTILDRGKEGALLGGSFAGESNCQILVSLSEFINEVESITVMLPESLSWWTLKATYENFKEKLTRKYGHPESIEQFYDPYYEGDGYEITALENQKAFYSSKFNADKGCIRVTIGANRVYISYIDTINEKRIEEKRNSIADFDL